MKKIFTAVAAAALAISANAAALTVIHTTPGGFAEELTAACDEAGISVADVTELTIISGYTEAGMAKDEADRLETDKANMTLADFQSLRIESVVLTNLANKPSRLGNQTLKKIDVSKVYFPNNTTPGGQWDSGTAMANFIALEEAVLPDNLEKLYGGVFENDFKLKKVNIPSNLSVIGSYCFCECKALELSGTLPESLTFIGQEAFATKSESVGLPNVKLTGTLENVKTFGQSAFRATPVTFYGCLKAAEGIGEHAFNGSNVAFDSFGDKVQKINEKAFRNTKVTFTSIPASCTSVGNAVFVNCPITEFDIDGVLEEKIPNQFFWFSQPVTFYCRALTPPTANAATSGYTNAFNQANVGNITMYVLKDAEAAYKATAPYSTFKSIKVLESKMTITTEGENYGAEYLKIEHPHHGVLAHNQEHSIYEGEHEWTFTPGWNHHIESIRFVEPAGVKALAEEAEEGEEEGEEVVDPNILYQLDPAADKTAMAAKAVTVKVPVGPANRTLAVTYAITDPTQTSFEALVVDSAAPEEIFDTMGRRINVAKEALPAGIYIIRQGSRTTKIVK